MCFYRTFFANDVSCNSKQNLPSFFYLAGLIYVFFNVCANCSCKGSVKIWDAKRNLQPYNEIRSSNKGNIIAAVSHSHRFVIAW